MADLTARMMAGNVVRLRPVAAIAETFPRHGSGAIPTGVLISGRLQTVAIELPLGFPITSITFVSGTIGAATPANQWFAIFDYNRFLIRQTIDDLTTAWLANTPKLLPLSSVYVTTYAGLHYLGVNVVAGTVPNLVCVTGSSVANSLPPVTAGPSTTGLTTTAPVQAAAIAGSGIMPWSYVS